MRVCVHVLKTAQARRCMCDSLRPGLKRPHTQKEPEKSEEVVVRDQEWGCLPPPVQELGERKRKKMQGPGGGNWGSQMAMGAAREPEAGAGGGWVEECAQPPQRRDPGQSWSLRSWSELLFSSLPRNLFQETPGLASGPAGVTTHTHMAVHIYTCSLFLCRVVSSLCSRPGHHCWSLLLGDAAIRAGLMGERALLAQPLPLRS